MDIIRRYFPELSPEQDKQMSLLYPLYQEWNEKINVISRNDIQNLYERHILHSLSIAKFFKFPAGTTFLDVGTGGGFPGIPLAIALPHCKFTLTDSIGKKIKVVNGIAESIGLKNVNAIHENVKNIRNKYHYILSRAVTTLPEFIPLVQKNILPSPKGKMPHGIIYIKGGNIQSELDGIKQYHEIFDISDVFEEDFFETKKVIFLAF